MIRAIAFDLDGTLVQTEKLKALSYAIAVQKLRGLSEPDTRAIEAYREIVGAARDIASKHVMTALDLEADLSSRMGEHGASEPWEVLTALRVSIYTEIVADPQVIRDNQWPHVVELLRASRDNACRTALATMSARKEAMHVLQALGLEESLDIVLTREDVKQPKPDPEIYLLAAQKLGISPEEFLTLEDSPNGVHAAVDAGMNVIAMATPFTIAGLHSSEALDHAWVVHDHDHLLNTVQQRIAEHNKTVNK